MLAKGKVFLDDRGQPIRFAGISLEITDRKRAEEQRAQFAAIVESSDLAIIGETLSGTIVSWNGGAENLYGYSAEEVVGKNISLLIPPAHQNRLPSVLERLGRGERIQHVETTRVRKDGHLVPVSLALSPIRTPTGAVVGISGIARDITEQKQVETKLRQSEERLKNAERLAHLGHWQWDLTSNHVSWSEEMFRIFGKPPDYVPTYDGVLEAIVPDDRVRVERYVRDRLGERIQSSTEFRVIRPDGDLRTVSAVYEVSRNQEGQLASLFGACQDITEVRRAQQESVARQKLESVGTLASGIAHDFNNLLGGVLAESELALAELAGGVHPEEELKAIRDVALRGSEIVRQLMVYAGKERAVVGLVDLSRVVKEMVELLKVSVTKHAVLETDLGKGLPAIQADAAQLRQIVMNLVTNASDAIGDRDGVIHVATRYAKAAEQHSPGGESLPADIHYVQLVVSDTGRGMSPGMQPRVFDPFFTTKSAGHGLGLAIVDGIVRSLHGKIHLASELGKGTTVEISLPCGGITAVLERQSPIEETVQFSEWATVLVVEDEEVLRRAAAQALRMRGFQVLEASNGLTAIDVVAASGSRIDVILLDMTIPGSSIHEIVAAYTRARADAKVILTSAYSEEIARATLSAPQIRGFIRKPFYLADLARTIRTTLSS